MVPHPVPKKPDRRPWAALVLVLIVGFVWCSSEEDPPESSSPTAVFVPTPEPEPEPIAFAPEPIDSGAELDAGFEDVFDAGQPAVLARKEPDVAEYMRRWRAALEPLFKYRQYPGAPTVLHASEQEEPVTPPDAGHCESEVRRLALIGTLKRDLVVVVDTSGSMSRALKPIVEWLAQLEKQIVDSKLDIQLLVLADQRSLKRKRTDGGINWSVGSYDTLNVLVAGARSNASLGQRWVDFLRPGAELMLVAVTDDRPFGGSAESHHAELTEVLGGRPFVFHVLGGFQVGTHQVLSPEEPLATGTCHAEGISGMNEGTTYQELARLTRGSRAPLCFELAREELLSVLVAPTLSSSGCAWLLSDERHQVDAVNAVSERRAPDRLLEERSAASCVAMRRSYRRAGALLMLCEDTCSSLKQDGYDAVEVKLECAR